MTKCSRVLAGVVAVWVTWLTASCGPAATNATPGVDTVVISSMQFHPATLYVNKWDTVEWVNQDIVGHDVTRSPDKSWTSDTILPSHSWRRVVGEDLDYFCSIHPAMKGKIVIRQ